MDEETGRAARPVRKAVVRKRAAKPKRVRWSTRRENTFIATLAETSNVAASARASGLSESNVYRRRQVSPEFRERWTSALRDGVAKLETMLLERALNGVAKPVWHGGKQVGTMVEYSDRLALALLAAHRDGRTQGAVAMIDRSADELRAELLHTLSDMNSRMGGEG
ncbi:hypothetical protein [uncultured Sphingomonas sp.]|uniref:hypothetical protein n=1 Tax=uncultured Sphingomonas sp. TaxID=158754 RepID=UPI0025E9BAFD|nr:hypothetical protein [uncultured Sphingomonas sp.]